MGYPRRDGLERAGRGGSPTGREYHRIVVRGFRAPVPETADQPPPSLPFFSSRAANDAFA